MRHKKLSFDLMEGYLGRADRSPAFLREKEDDPDYRKMLRMLSRLTEEELTDRQRQCVQLYYFEGQKMRDVARLLGIQSSTVSRHLKKARSRMGQVLRYSFDRLAG